MGGYGKEEEKYTMEYFRGSKSVDEGWIRKEEIGAEVEAGGGDGGGSRRLGVISGRRA